MILTVDIILQEIDIRIGKLKTFLVEVEAARDVDSHKATRIRIREYESFKHWIEARRE
jgi:hypothetical protein